MASLLSQHHIVRSGRACWGIQGVSPELSPTEPLLERLKQRELGPVLTPDLRYGVCVGTSQATASENDKAPSVFQQRPGAQPCLQTRIPSELQGLPKASCGEGCSGLRKHRGRCVRTGDGDPGLRTRAAHSTGELPPGNTSSVVKGDTKSRSAPRPRCFLIYIRSSF